jgi:phosphoglycolate phosphatase
MPLGKGQRCEGPAISLVLNGIDTLRYFSAFCLLPRYKYRIHMTAPTILFDLDGTLIDSAPDVCRALNRTLEAVGRRAHTVPETTGYLGHGAPVLMKMALENTGSLPPDSEIDALTKNFLDDYAQNPVVDTVIFPGVLDALAVLRDQDYKLVICTNKPSVTAMPVLETFNLLPYFGAVVCADQVAKRKPDGAHVLDAIAAVGGVANRAIMVGDSENDIDAALDANVPSILVTFGYAQDDHGSLGANVLMDHFDELNDKIKDLLQNPVPA